MTRKTRLNNWRKRRKHPDDDTVAKWKNRKMGGKIKRRNIRVLRNIRVISKDWTKKELHLLDVRSGRTCTEWPETFERQRRGQEEGRETSQLMNSGRTVPKWGSGWSYKPNNLPQLNDREG